MLEQAKGSCKSHFDLMKNPYYWLPDIGAKAFGETFRYLREREGYSNRGLAAHLGIDETTMNRIEHG